MRLQTGVIRSRESRSEHTRKLVQAAYELIPEVGIAGLRTRDIAKRAGVHLATFHYCFESKNALLAGLYADIYNRFQAVIDQFVTPERDRLEGHRRMRHYLLHEDPNLLIAWKSFTGAIWTDRVIADIVRPSFREMRIRMSAYLAEEFKAGKLSGLARTSPEAAATIVLALYAGGLSHLWLDPEDVPLEPFEAALRILYGEPEAAE